MTTSWMPGAESERTLHSGTEIVQWGFCKTKNSLFLNVLVVTHEFMCCAFFSAYNLPKKKKGKLYEKSQNKSVVKNKSLEINI